MYQKETGSVTIYQGESFDLVVEKDDGSDWTETGYVELRDCENVIWTGGVTINGSSLSFILPKTETTALDGSYTLLVRVEDGADRNNVIVAYNLNVVSPLPPCS